MIFYLLNHFILFLSRLLPKHKPDFNTASSESDVLRNVNYLAHGLRKVKKSGAGVSVSAIELRINQAYKVIKRKERLLKDGGGVEIFAFEKWIEENYRLLSSATAKLKRRSFATLPHCGGVPRIISVADFAVKFSAGNLTRDRLEKVIKAFNSITPLKYAELKRLGDAVAYCMLAEISKLCEKCINYYVNSEYAARAKFMRKKRLADSYLYFYAARHPGCDTSEMQREFGVDFKSAEVGFFNVISSNETIVSAYINSIRNLNKIMPEHGYISLVPANEIYLHDCDYRNMSALAKSDYLKATSELSERYNVSESAVALCAVKLAKHHGVHFGDFLFNNKEALRAELLYGKIAPLKKRTKPTSGGYCAAVILTSLFLAALPAYFLRNIFAYLCVLPLFIVALHPVEYFIKKACSIRKFSRPLPAMDYDKIPQKFSTVVIVSAFVNSVDAMKKNIDNVIAKSTDTHDENVNYALLVDLPSSPEPLGEMDREIQEYLQGKSLPESVGVFVRHKVYNGKKYVGYERKRGAILQFLSAVKSGNFDAFYTYGKQPSAQLAVLLDEDSVLLPHTLLPAINAMAHPLNQKYDLMAFGGRINRYSHCTYYSGKFTRSAGVDAYPSYSDFYSDKFDCAMYCGKAIIRVESYLEKLSEFFPDGRVLSHDIIEGAVLNSCALRRNVYEDAPHNFASEYQRKTRWERGDVQLLPYALFRRVKNKNGIKIKNPVAPIYRLIMFINAFSVLADAAVFLIGVFAILLGERFLLMYAVTLGASVYIHAFIMSLRQFVAKIKLSHCFSVAAYSLWLVADYVLLLPFRAVEGLVTFFTTVFKMIFGKGDLLNWKPFASGQASGSIGEGAAMMLPSALVLIALTFVIRWYVFLTYAMLVVLYCVAVLLMGKRLPKTRIHAWQRQMLSDVGKKIYGYFCDCFNGGLVPDNLQLYPFLIKSKMTSPTNIGFAMLSEVSAANLGYCSEEQAIERITTIVSVCEELPKWNGHLYNWYNVQTKEIMPPAVVSTVDSANFIACAICCKQFAKNKGFENLSDRLDALISNADFAPLFDEGEKLLCIVHNVAEGISYGRYDLLSSEARLAYLIAIGKGIKTESYFALGREFCHTLGNTLMSWSGTAFEYMLPRLFLRAPTGSLIAQQEVKSGKMQIRYKSKKIFGRSECGYGELNSAMAYKYKAVGVPALALSKECADVVAPYASFLYFQTFPTECSDNLRRLSNMGCEGDYGYFEAIDFDRGDVIVKSYMAHHQGMSVAAVANAVCDDCLCKLFEAEPFVQNVKILLSEEPVYAVQPKVISCECNKVYERACDFVPDMKTQPAEVFVLGNGKYKTVIDKYGRGYSCYGDKKLDKYLPYKQIKGGIFAVVATEGKMCAPTVFPLKDVTCKTSANCNQVAFSNADNSVVMRVEPLGGYDGELRKLTLRNTSKNEVEYEVAFYSDMVLNDDDSYYSHPAFSDMFVRGEIDADRNTALLLRRNLNCKDTLAVSFTVKGLENIFFNCNRYNVMGRCNVDDFANVFEGVKCNAEPICGDVLYPCFAVSGKVKIAPESSTEIYLTVMAAEDKASLISCVDKISSAYEAGGLDLLVGHGTESDFSISVTASIGAYLTGVLPRFSLPENKCDSRWCVLEKYGVTQEDKIVYCNADKFSDKEYLKQILNASERLNSALIKHKVLISAEEKPGAQKSNLQLLREYVNRFSSTAVVITSEDAEKCGVCEFADFIDEFLFEKQKRELVFENVKTDSAQVDLPLPLLKSGEGCFTQNGYSVVPFWNKTALPYANVVGCKNGGFVITENGGGFTFGKNSREDKISLWSGDAVEDFPSEQILVCLSEKTYRLNCSHNGGCTHKTGSTEFVKIVDGVHCVCTVYPVESGRGKVYDLLLQSGNDVQGAKVVFKLYPALGWKYSERISVSETAGGYLLENLAGGHSAKVVSSGADIKFVKREPALCEDGFEFECNVNFNGKKANIRIAILNSDADLPEGKKLLASRSLAESETHKSTVVVHSADKALNLLYNSCLPYQVLSCRINARSGFYQCSGAIGFRDQLQDMLGMLLSDPELVRKHLINAAAHQYEEGDVQHWWHPPFTGVRTRISDDKLWLGYVCAKYVKTSGDFALLDEKIPFLSSPVLCEENSRYETPLQGCSATMTEHIWRTFKSALCYGENGLLKIGTGDWNDGLDKVGEKGRGESVWLTMFAVAVIDEVADFFADERRRFLLAEKKKMCAAVAMTFNGDRFPMCFADDGKWLGLANSDVCKLSLNSQTWAVISGCVNKDVAARAMDTAKALKDERHKIVKLLAPPFDVNNNYGYISAYPEGVRENGGQYTHAAIWYFKALLTQGKNDEAYKVLELLNPLNRSVDERTAKEYKGEPYVLAGDVYSGTRAGRCGWTWYTGSAAWLYNTLTEDFFGVRKRGSKVYFTPCLPRKFASFALTVNFGDTLLDVSYVRSDKNQLAVNGEICECVDLERVSGRVNVKIEWVPRE